MRESEREREREREREGTNRHEKLLMRRSPRMRDTNKLQENRRRIRKER